MVSVLFSKNNRKYKNRLIFISLYDIMFSVSELSIALLSKVTDGLLC